VACSQVSLTFDFYGFFRLVQLSWWSRRSILTLHRSEETWSHLKQTVAQLIRLYLGLDVRELQLGWWLLLIRLYSCLWTFESCQLVVAEWNQSWPSSYQDCFPSHWWSRECLEQFGRQRSGHWLRFRMTFTLSACAAPTTMLNVERSNLAEMDLLNLDIPKLNI